MIDMLGSLVGAVLLSIGHALRYLSAVVALLLLIQAIFMGRIPLRIGRSLYLATSIFERPVRRLLPESVTSAPHDYTPVVAAILVLVLGLGAHEVFEVLTYELHLIPAMP